ncbi:MAG: hypothetical protein QXV69_04440 [Sulfolobaceae archaeon]
MDEQKKLLLISAIPVIGGVVSNYYLSLKISKINKLIKLLLISISVSVISTLILALYFFREIILEIFGAIIIANFVSIFLGRKRKLSNDIKLKINEYYIEILTNIDFDEGDIIKDPNEIYTKVINQALSKIKSPYYKQKLLETLKCNNLKLFLSEDKIVLRRKCGDTIVEITLRGIKGELKVSILY